MSEGAGPAAPAATEEPVLRAEGVTAGYGGPPIVEDISIAVPAGKITAVVGPNGAGKSTLLKALSGVVRTELFPDLGRSLRRRAGLLSGGQRTMLAISRALMLEPAVLLLDEPSAGLSPLLQGALWEQIERVADTGVGICVVEQNTRRTLRHAHWGYILVLGRNRLDGPARQLLEDESVVQLYVGRMN